MNPTTYTSALSENNVYERIYVDGRREQGFTTIRVPAETTLYSAIRGLDIGVKYLDLALQEALTSNQAIESNLIAGEA